MSAEGHSEPRWLDMHLARRVAEFLPPSALPREGDAYFLPPYGELLLAMRKWQIHMLRVNMLRCVASSFGYRKKLAHDAQAGLMRALAETSLATGAQGAVYPEAEAEALEAVISNALSSLPFTFPQELVDAPESFLAVSHGDISGIISLLTSGTTGQGKRIFCTEEDLRQTADFFRHGMQFMIRPGREDSVALMMSGGRPGSVGSLFIRAMRELGVPCIVPGFVPPSGKSEDAMVGHLIDSAPTCLVGVPGQMVLLARHDRAHELARSVRSVLLSGDSVTPEAREAIARGLGAAVFVHYGLTETGLGGAVECPQLAGCHMREADLIHEILDEQGRPVEKGEWGEIVITTLSREAMPLLRYRTGDEGRILPDPCACGSVFGRLEVGGRMSQRLGLPDGSILRITDLDRVLYSLPYIQSYTPVVHGENSAMRLKLMLRVADGVGDTALFEAEKAVSALPGLQLCLAGDEAARKGLLPVMLVLERPRVVFGKHMQDVRTGQAKRCFVRAD